jgi:hypothetical protein
MAESGMWMAMYRTEENTTDRCITQMVRWVQCAAPVGCPRPCPRPYEKGPPRQGDKGDKGDKGSGGVEAWTRSCHFTRPSPRSWSCAASPTAFWRVTRMHSSVKGGPTDQTSPVNSLTPAGLQSTGVTGPGRLLGVGELTSCRLVTPVTAADCQTRSHGASGPTTPTLEV